MNDNLILMVDDEPGILRVLGISLEDAGYRVVVAGDGQQALKAFREIAYPPIILTDIKMPGMDGIELLRTVKAENPATEVIMMTGHGDMDLAVRSLKYEATDFVTKPVGDEALEVALRRARERIDLRRKLREHTDNLERLVERKSRELVEAERLAAVGETVAGLSHAIKNIASGLEGGVFVLEKGLELDNRQYLAEGWEMVRDNVGKIRNLSMDLLGFAKPSALQQTLCDPGTPAAEVVELMKPRAESLGVEIRLETNGEIRHTLLDPAGIHRCLLNLVTNALDACEDMGTPGRECRIIIRLRLSGGLLYYEVEDNCGGMGEEVQTNLFTRFFTTKGAGGSGLGLMMTRRIVEAHGGEISLESKEGAGSKFTIAIPSGTN